MSHGMKFVIAALLSIILLIAIGYFDFQIITPALLPEDECYYHFHEIPWWVELFYMNGASNGHPEGSIFHFFLLLAISIVLGITSTRWFARKVAR